MNPTDSVAQLRAIADHIDKHQLDISSVSVSWRDAPRVDVFREANMRTWAASLTNTHITAHVYDQDRVFMYISGNAGTTPIKIAYVCQADDEMDMYVAIAAQIGDADGDVDIQLPGTAVAVAA